MIGADEPTFVDTNVLLYGYDRGAGQRHELAQRWLRELWRHRTGRLSTQVLQEFYVNAQRKLTPRLPPGLAVRVLQRYRAWPVHSVAVPDVFEAFRVQQEQVLSLWDALIVVAAARSGATRLLTEDLNHGQVIEGVRVVNPFLAPAEP